MKECAYAGRLETEMLELETRLNAKRVTETDLYFLKNIGVLVECALEDYGCNDKEQRRQNNAFERNCALQDRDSEKVKSALPVMIREVETQLAVQSVVPSGGHLQFRLEEVRQQAHALEESLAGIISDASGGETHRKKPFGSGGSTGPSQSRMSDFLEQMRAA